MKQLPSDVTPYKKTPEFNEDTIPNGLLHEHSTGESVWAKIVVLEGRLEYRIHDPENEVLVLDPQTPGVVEPAVKHEVKPLGKVRFYVEFYR